MAQDKDAAGLAQQLVSANFQIQSGAGDGRQISYSGVFLDTDTLADKNAKFDEGMTIINRQRARQEIPMIEDNLINSIKQLDNLLVAYEDAKNHWAAQKGAEMKNKTKQLMDGMALQVKNAEHNIKVGQERLEYLRELVEEK